MVSEVLADVTTERFQVLSLDGGGVKALFTAQALAHLEDDLGIRVADHFDLIAGTSAGGIVALSLGAGLRPAEIVERYTELAQRVFPRSRRAKWRLASRALRPTYSGDTLRKVLTDVFGERRLGQSTKRLIVPAWDVQRGEVHIFKTPHNPRLHRDGRLSMVDVAMATTAAPTFFEAARVENQRLIDGGVWANNPSVVAIGEAVSMLGQPLAAIRVLNVGTVDQRTNHPERFDNGGWLNWAPSAASLMISASSRGVQGTATHLVGAENFLRFDALVPGDDFSLDRASPSALFGLASGQSRFLSTLFEEQLVDHVAAPYLPILRSTRRPHAPTPLGDDT